MNLKEETIQAILSNGKGIADIEWIGSEDIKIPIDNFWEISDFVYDDGFGAQRVPADLVIVGKNWWLERTEYDGSEGWVFKEKPIEPTKTMKLKKIPLGMWDILIDLIERSESD